MANIIKNSYRHNVVNLLESCNGNVGVELGVAKGIFSLRMMESGYFSYFFGIDAYADLHDVNEYKEVVNKIGLFSNYKLLRMTFDEAYDLFDDESLDFIYVDGCAHTGENGGKTIFDWSRKVKIGGVISGDDYHDDWPLVVEAVDEFVLLSGFNLNLTANVEDDPYCNYPSWAVIKDTDTCDMRPSEQLLKKGHRAKRPRKKLLSLVVGYLHKDIVNWLKKYKNR